MSDFRNTITDTGTISLRIITSDGSVASIYLNGRDSGKRTPNSILLETDNLQETKITLVTEAIRYRESYNIGYDTNREIKLFRIIGDNETEITDNVLTFTPISVSTSPTPITTPTSCMKYSAMPIDIMGDSTRLTGTTITENIGNESLSGIDSLLRNETRQIVVSLNKISYIDCNSGERIILDINEPKIFYAILDTIEVIQGEVEITPYIEDVEVRNGIVPIEYSNIIINVDGDDGSVSMQTPNGEIVVLRGDSNTVRGITNSIYNIKSSNSTIFKISKIAISNNLLNEEADGGETLSVNVPIRDGIIVNITTERVVYSVTPEIEIGITDVIDYNINSEDDLIIQTFPLNTDGVIVEIGDREYCYTIKNFDGRLVEIVGEENQISNGKVEQCAKVKDITTGEINDENIEVKNFYNVVIPKRALQSVKDYIVSITPINKFGRGRPVSVNVNVFDGVLITTPDLFNISFPSKLQGPDFVGTDVPFTIEWESVDTNYVKIYYGEQRQSFITTAQNSINLNVGDILKNINESELSVIDRFVNFTIALVPVNTEGFENVFGDAEILSIGFKEGDLAIPRSVAVDRIRDEFIKQLDVSTFESTTNNLLNHFFHLGDGKNVLISNWAGSSDGSLIIKLYEPLPTDVQINNTGWISKIQANPTIQTINLFGEVDDFYPFIKGPNFSIDVDGGSAYQIVENILGSTSPITSEQLITDFVTRSGIDIGELDIEYATDTTVLFENFVHFGSATERVINYQYKVSLINDYDSKINELELLVSPNPVDVKQIERIKELRRELIGGFDGFERFLYNDASPTVLSDALSQAELYDRNNVNYLVNNIPTYLIESNDNVDFTLFLDMIGQHFDILWSYTNGIKSSKRLRENTKGNLSNKLVYHMLESFGWNPKRPFDTISLWEAAFGQNSDGTSLYDTPLNEATNEVWKRILNNLPYLLKHKGTKRAIQAMMACYGVPNSLLTIFEFGGPTNQRNSEPSKFTFDDNTFSILFDGQSKIDVNWDEFEGDYPNSIELRINTTEVITQSLLKTDGWELSLIPTNTSSFGVLQLDIDNQSISTQPMPFFTDEYNHIVVNKNNSSIDIFALRNDITDIKQIVSASISTTIGWDNGSTLEIGDGFIGELDEFRLWRTPLEERVIKAHSLFPQSISGNTLTSSTDDLLFRLDFELPRNRGNLGDTSINNVSVNQLYASDATAVGFPNISDYPHNYKNYTRTVSATIPSVGFTYSDKIRIETQDLIGDLSYNQRATVKAFDRSPVDSNRLGIFLSPNKELNFDIIKSFGENLSIDDLIGNPADTYNDKYRELDVLREYYFKRLNRNIYEYIRLIRYIDKSLFETLTDLVPVRAKVSKGLLIEPHILERSKVQWKRPDGDENTNEGIVDGDIGFDVLSEVLTNSATIVFEEEEVVDVELGTIDTLIQYTTDDVLKGENVTYEGDIEYSEVSEILASYEALSATITSPQIGSLKTETDLGLDLSKIEDDSYTDIGFGLYAINGTASLFNQLDNNGNLIRERRRVFVLRERRDVEVNSFIPNSGSFEKFTVPIFTTRITTLPIDSTVDIQPDNIIISATPLNGYLPVHYRNSNVPTGLRNSFYNGSVQTVTTTPDGLPPVEVFTTNPNILRVADTGRGSGEPILTIK